MKVLHNARSGTLANYPMQSAGADMLRLACVMAVDRNIPICAPIHDAIAVEAASTEIADVVNDMARCMVEASRAVLGGPAIRIDPKSCSTPTATWTAATAAPNCGRPLLVCCNSCSNRSHE